MANPLFNGNSAAMGGMANMANAANVLGNVNPQTIQQVMNMINRGADIKEIIVTFKKSGMSPQVAEQALCMAFPQFKQLKQQVDTMKKSGMSQQDIFSNFAKQANVSPDQINTTYNNLMKLVK